MALTPDVIRLIDESVLCWLATSSASGQPSVSPKEVFTPYNGDSIVIANIASPGSARNIRENPKACVSFINVFTQRGYQVSGDAMMLHQGDDEYPEIHRSLYAISGDDFPFKSAFRVMANDIKPIIAPRYRLFPQTTEQDQIESAMRTYGVQPQSS